MSMHTSKVFSACLIGLTILIGNIVFCCKVLLRDKKVGLSTAEKPKSEP